MTFQGSQCRWWEIQALSRGRALNLRSKYNTVTNLYEETRGKRNN